MDATEHIVALYALNLAYARQLTSDIDDAIAAEPAGAGLENHPVFLIGHLCCGSAMTACDLGAEGLDLPESWPDLFGRRGPSDPRLPQSAVPYPSLADTMAELSRQHERVERLLRAADPATLDEPCEWRLAAYLPTNRLAIAFMCITHEALHLGQLAAWRRARGLPSAMARM